MQTGWRMMVVRLVWDQLDWVRLPAARQSLESSAMNYIRNLYEGRINRKTYILGLIILGGIFGISFLLLGNMDGVMPSVLLILASVLHFIYSFSLHVRRAHDIGKENYYAFLLLVPIVGLAILIILVLRKGEDIFNVYGDPQKQSSLKTIFASENHQETMAG